MTWPSKLHQYQPLLHQWAGEHPDLLELDHVVQFGGSECYCATLTRGEATDEARKALIVTVPHAHEPGGTVACIDFICQLVKGENLAEQPTDLDRDAILDRLVLTFIPDANPAGRERAPEDVWDGTKYSNDDFLKIAFGIEATTGERFPRPGRWCMEEYQVAQLGIVWEQIHDYVYVEPNRDLDSSLCRLVRTAFKARDYQGILHLHQTELEKSEHDCFAILPVLQDDLPEALQQQNVAWAEDLIAEWQRVGANPIPEPRRLGYQEDQLQLFRDTWGDIQQRMPSLTIEVQNNNTRT
ncbi:MAG: M14 family zinc carboxypeptidase, partial [Armatimonadota bacterium]